MPNRSYLDNVKMLRLESKGGTEKYLSGTRKTYFQNEYCIPHGMDWLARRGLWFSESLGPTPPGDHLLIVGPNMTTTDHVEFNYDFSGKDEFDSPEASPRRGDGTVPTFSACAAAGSSPWRFITDDSYTMRLNDTGSCVCWNAIWTSNQRLKTRKNAPRNRSASNIVKRPQIILLRLLLLSLRLLRRRLRYPKTAGLMAR